MSWQAGATVAAFLLLIVVRNRVAPSLALLLSMTLLFLTGVISTKDALSGFSNPAPFTVAALYVIARAVERTGALTGVIARVAGKSDSWRMQLLRICSASAFVSAFLNNTPIVAMLTPPLTLWSDDRREPPSKYLIPMCYAVNLGGTILLIGTSTSLIASGLAQAAGEPAFGMLEIARLGIPVALVGVLVLVAITPWALPVRRAARDALTASARDFFVTMQVVPGGPLDGKTVAQAGLRSLEGVFLIEVDHGTTRTVPVGPATVLTGGDDLTFVGKADNVVDLHSMRGLASTDYSIIRAFDPREHPFFEAVVGPDSPLVGRTLKEVGFRTRYQAAVIAIHRRGERLRAKLGEVKLKAGDTLLFIADPGFRRNDFLLVSRIGRPTRPTGERAHIAGLIVLGLVVVAVTGLVPLLQACLGAVLLIVLLRVIPPSEVRESVDGDVLVAVGASFALSAAAEKSGLVKVAVDAIVGSSTTLGPKGALLVTTLVTVAAAQFLTCNAVAALCIPLALAVAKRMQVDPRAFLMATTVAASTTYLTPFGYQTKLMVFGPGGYKSSDYTRVGLPVTVAVVAVIATVAPIAWPFG